MGDTHDSPFRFRGHLDRMQPHFSGGSQTDV